VGKIVEAGNVVKSKLSGADRAGNDSDDTTTARTTME